MTDTTYSSIERLNRPLYSYAESDRLAHASPGTSSRWLKGYNSWSPKGKVRMPPVTSGTRKQQEAVSFSDLLEIVVISKLREQGLSLPKVRLFVEHCQETLNIARPLVTEAFKTDGREIFVSKESGVLLQVGMRSAQQAWDEVLDPFLDTLDYSRLALDYGELAYRWWPLGREGRVFVDPDYGFGLPTIEGTGVRTEIVAERFSVGESPEEIAEDFRITPSQVESALRYELSEAA